MLAENIGKLGLSYSIDTTTLENCSVLKVSIDSPYNLEVALRHTHTPQR
jgi:hypothetical protein